MNIIRQKLHNFCNNDLKIMWNYLSAKQWQLLQKKQVESFCNHTSSHGWDLGWTLGTTFPCSLLERIENKSVNNAAPQGQTQKNAGAKRWKSYRIFTFGCSSTKNDTPYRHFAESGIVSSRVATPFSKGTPPFWVPPIFWSKFKKLPPSFWEPSKLVHVNCKKNFKMKVLHLVLYKVNWEYH